MRRIEMARGVVLFLVSVGAVSAGRVGRRLTAGEVAEAMHAAESRQLYDVPALVEFNRANRLPDGECTCPFLAEGRTCDEARIYNNSFFFEPVPTEPALIVSGSKGFLVDAASAGFDNCQRINGLNLCIEDPTCVPLPEYLIYDCAELATTLVGVAYTRAANELANETDESGRARLDFATLGAISGDDDIWDGLNPTAVWLYLNLESTGYFSCTGGCDIYEACKDACLGNGGQDFTDNFAATLTTPCAEEVIALTQPPTVSPAPTAAPSVSPAPTTVPTAPSPAPTAAPSVSLAPSVSPTPSPTETKAPTASLAPAAAPTVDPSTADRSGSKKKKSSSISEASVLAISIVAVVVGLCLCCVFAYIFYASASREAKDADEDEANLVVAPGEKAAVPAAGELEAGGGCDDVALVAGGASAAQDIDPSKPLYSADI